MENTTLSLFEDASFEEQKQEKKAAAKKKVGKKTTPLANSMFSFDDEVVESNAANNIEIADKNKEAENLKESNDTKTALEENDLAKTDDLSIEVATETSINTGDNQNETTIYIDEEPLIEALNTREEEELVNEAPNENLPNDEQILEQQYLGSLAEAGYDILHVTNNKKSALAKEEIENNPINKHPEEAKEIENNSSPTSTSINFDLTLSGNEKEVLTLPEWHLTKQYYTIGEVANLFNVNTSHIRFWSKEFKFKLRTNRKGDRHYTVEDINKLRVIYDLVKIKKHTIKGAREKLLFEKKQVIQHISLKEQLKDLQHTLIHLKNTIS